MPKIGDMIKARELGYKGAGYYIWWACINCDKEKWIRHNKKIMREFKCRSCSQKGRFNPNWKGGVTKNSYGYLIYRVPENHKYSCMKNSNNMILLHRLIMAIHLQRPLKDEELVHHINGDITDNRISNLKLMGCKGEHTKLHHKLGWRKTILDKE